MNGQLKSTSMKKFVIFLGSMLGWMSAHTQEPLNAMTFNIRYNTAKDSMNAWPYRKDFLISQILFHEASIIGVQEALHDQVMDLLKGMPGYRYVGVGRDDGKEAGEYSAIFFDTGRVRILETKTFWLSPEPDVPGSKGWDAAITRIVTLAKFTDKRTGKSFFAFNTHFDHIGKIARRESATLLLRKINDIAGNAPVIVTGDFNSVPTDEPIRIITDQHNGMQLIDSKSVSRSPHYGPSGTFNGFTSKETIENPIDYIFIKNRLLVLKHATLSQSWQGRFSSDHFPVFARLLIQ
jgi:endonuclease/exonuclease/phosphatase family metal-dependent hydrolase